MRGRLAAAALLGAVIALPPGRAVDANADDGWVLRSRIDPVGEGYALFERPREGSRYPEYRLEIVLDAKPEDVMAALERNLLDPRSYPPGLERELLRRGKNVLVTHDTFRVPILADRDIVLRIEIEADPERGVHHVRWRPTPEEGPPPQNGVVRMPSSEGSWTLLRRESGDTLGIYRSHVEPGSALPSVMVGVGTRREIIRQAAELRRAVRERTHGRSAQEGIR